MISEDLNSVGAGLDRLIEELSGEQADMARLCRDNLRAAEEQAAHLESGLCVLSRVVPEATQANI